MCALPLRLCRMRLTAPDKPDKPARLVPDAGRAIAYKEFRRLDRSAKRGAERPCLNDKRLIVETKSLHSGRSLPRAKSRGPLSRRRGVAICDSPAIAGERSLIRRYVHTLIGSRFAEPALA